VIVALILGEVTAYEGGLCLSSCKHLMQTDSREYKQTLTQVSYLYTLCMT